MRKPGSRGWGVVNERINKSRQKCPKCGHNTSIVTRERGRFCTWCFRYDSEEYKKIQEKYLEKLGRRK